MATLHLILFYLVLYYCIDETWILTQTCLYTFYLSVINNIVSPSAHHFVFSSVRDTPCMYVKFSASLQYYYTSATVNFVEY